MRCQDSEMDPGVHSNFEGRGVGDPGGQEPNFMLVEENVEKEELGWSYGSPSFW